MKKKKLYCHIKKNNGMGLIAALIISVCIASFSTVIINDCLQSKRMMQLINLRYTVEKLRKQIINVSFVSIIKSMNDTYNSQMNNCYENNACGSVSTFKPFKLLAPDGSNIGSGEGVFYDSNGSTCSSWSTGCPIKLTLNAKISGGQLFLKYEIKTQDMIANLGDVDGAISLSVNYIRNSENFILSCTDPKQLIGINTDGTPICIPPKYKDVHVEVNL